MLVMFIVLVYYASCDFFRISSVCSDQVVTAVQVGVLAFTVLNNGNLFLQLFRIIVKEEVITFIKTQPPSLLWSDHPPSINDILSSFLSAARAYL